MTDYHLTQAGTAIRLAKAVEKVNVNIGTWVGGEEDFKGEHDLYSEDEDEEEEEDADESMEEESEEQRKDLKRGREEKPVVLKEMKQGTVNSIYAEIEKITRKYESAYAWDMGSKTIKVVEPELDCKIDDLREPGLVEELYEKGAVSGFGDMKKMETVIDENVRKAREYLADKVKLDEALLIQATKFWKDNFLPSNVKLKFYKMNIYGPGGKFTSHKDTPEPGLIGTVLLNVFDNSVTEKWDTNFIVDGQKIHFHSGRSLAFFTDVVHEVLPITSGYRITLAFKVFMNDDAVTTTEAVSSGTQIVEKEIAEIIRKTELPFGILLSHEYILAKEVQMKGADLVLKNCLDKCSKVQLTCLPVVMKFSAEKPIGEVPTYESSVYAFTDEHVRYALGETKTAPDWPLDDHSINFFNFGSNAFLWSENNDQGAEHTGNDSRDGSEDAVYLNYAIIVHEPLKKKAEKPAAAENKKKQKSKK